MSWYNETGGVLVKCVKGDQGGGREGGGALGFLFMLHSRFVYGGDFLTCRILTATAAGHLCVDACFCA